jgi:DNA-binding winged helix-turn-helix (wHTH) protein
MMEFLAFRLDTVNQCLWRRTDGGEDERIRLSPKPFALLCYLVEHPGRLVTEDEILGAVWPKLYVQPESIKTQIHEIRRVLGDDPKTPRYIETVPRRGYQFIAPVSEGPAPDLAAERRPTRGHLVGRERELLKLLDYLRAASRGQRQVVFVCGEPGIGKTALVDEFQQRAMNEVPTLRIARGQCIEAYGGTEAYYPILEALSQLCVGSAAASIVEVLAAQAPTWLVQFPALLTERHREVLRQEILGATRERMLREFGAALETIAAEHPLLLEIEDLQWVDHSTIDLISALARRRVPAKLMLIATSRPLGMDQPPSALKQDLLLRRLCHEVELEPLTEAQVAEYLRAESPDGNCPKGLAELVSRRSEGNPLFMVAALDHLMQRGFISQQKGSWHLIMPLEEIDLGVPDNLRRMIETQIDLLSTEEQRALEAASVQGVAFSASVCAAVINGDVEGYENLYDSMVHQRRMLRGSGTQQLPDGSVSSRCEFVHALYREVLYRRQPPRHRSRLHRRIGDRLETLYSQQLSEVGSELAYHFEESGEWPRTIKYLRLAADAAERRYGHREAIELLRHALECTRRLPVADWSATEIELLQKLADILYLSLDASAPQAYEALASRAAQCGAIDVEVRALIATAVLWSWSDSERSLHYLGRALSISAQQADPLARAASQAACLYWRLEISGWSDADATAYAKALAELQGAGYRPVPGEYLIWYSYFLLMRAQYREARQSAIDGLLELTHGVSGNPCATLPQVQAAHAVCINSLFLGEWGEALREFDATIAAVSKSGNDVFANGMRIWRAWLSVFAMDFHDALANCQSAAEALGDSIIPTLQRIYLTVAATAELSIGQHERAFEHLTLARQAMDRQRAMHDYVTRLPLESVTTEFWLVRDDIAKAQQHGAHFLRIALATPERTWQALAWEVNARIALKERDVKRAAEHIAEALFLIEGFELPLAAWRVHATAAVIYEQQEGLQRAEHYRALSRATILKIASSLPPEHRLRRSFLSAAPVAQILGSG